MTWCRRHLFLALAVLVLVGVGTWLMWRDTTARRDESAKMNRARIVEALHALLRRHNQDAFVIFEEPPASRESTGSKKG